MAAKKVEAPVKEPRVSVGKDVRQRVESLAGALKTFHGENVFSDEKTIEGAVFALFALTDPVTNVRAALKRLREEFVDFNEARVATKYELHDVLEGVRFQDLQRSVEDLRNLLTQLFDELNSFDFQALEKLGPERARKKLAKVETPEVIRQYVLCLAGVENAPPYGEETRRVLERTGVLDSVEDDEGRRRKVLGTIFKDGDALNFHHLLVEHAKKLCTEKAPRCAKCPLEPTCAYAKDPARRKTDELRIAERAVKEAEAKAARKAARKAESEAKMFREPIGDEPPLKGRPLKLEAAPKGEGSGKDDKGARPKKLAEGGKGGEKPKDGEPDAKKRKKSGEKAKGDDAKPKAKKGELDAKKRKEGAEKAKSDDAKLKAKKGELDAKKRKEGAEKPKDKKKAKVKAKSAKK